MSDALTRVVVVCRRALLCLALSVAGSVNLAPALAQPVEIVDANGTKIGSDVLGVQGQGPLVALNLDGRVFTLVVTQNGFDGTFLLLFASPDCFGTGTPFLLDNSLSFPSGAVDPTILPPVAIAPPGSTVFLPVPGSPSQSLAVSSLLSADGTYEALPAPFTMQAFPAQALSDLSTQFVPPFRVQILSSLYHRALLLGRKMGIFAQPPIFSQCNVGFR